ncbi:MAG TPA: TonB-dependent receptor, partial [Chryseolinea sp.]|nr:TonB-dependent receptor [Chryseolinea sp.]
DDVPIYNTSHLFGFLSVFNPDILERVEAINGGFPAEYGGRLSSILNVQTVSMIPERTHLSADIGIIATRIHLDQPIVKNKASIWLAGRRTYIDQVVRVLNEELPYYFYDLNGKLILQPTERDNISFSSYVGEDILDIFRDRNNDGDGFLTKYESGNNSQSLRWQRTMRNRWHGNLSMIRSKYKYSVLNTFEENELVARSDIEDYGARLMFRKDSIFRNLSFKTGADWTRHQLNPNVINSIGTIAELLESSSSKGHVANEFAAYTQFDWSPADRWQIGAGIRGSMAAVASKVYMYPEPRFSVRYSLTENQALKFSYARMVQYLHRISYSAVSSPTDIWYPVTGRIRPQTSHQVALGWQQSLLDRHAFLSIEGYYKQMNQLIGYEEGTNLFLNNDFEPHLIQGKGKAYGVEVLLRKDIGRFTGWISYTLSWSLRQFDVINQGNWFPSRYDRRHNGAIVMQYRFAERWAASIVWEFISGARFTPIIGQYGVFAPTLTGVDLIPVYSGINQVSLADAHRLDAGIKFKSKSGKRFQWQVFAGVYNAYNRANPVGITIEQDEVTGELRYEQPGLFGLIPFVSYGFRF